VAAGGRARNLAAGPSIGANDYCAALRYAATASISPFLEQCRISRDGLDLWPGLGRWVFGHFEHVCITHCRDEAAHGRIFRRIARAAFEVAQLDVGIALALAPDIWNHRGAWQRAGYMERGTASSTEARLRSRHLK
jgi:hypothetical protein